MMILPFAYLVIFHYVPMAGIVLAFQDYKMGRGVFGSDWVGFRWFIEFFESFYFWRLMRNTLLLSFYTIVFGFPVPIIFALMLNEMRVLPLKRVVQTVSYLPHFISLVIVVGMLVTFLSPNNGIVNIVIKLGGGSRSTSWACRAGSGRSTSAPASGSRSASARSSTWPPSPASARSCMTPRR